MAVDAKQVHGGHLCVSECFAHHNSAALFDYPVALCLILTYMLLSSKELHLWLDPTTPGMSAFICVRT